jgi:CelD/BcsL family acetyltransferase involved in cellulose biosynthesis
VTPGRRRLWKHYPAVGWRKQESSGHTPPVAGSQLELRVQDDLGGLAGDWDALAASQPLPSPFLRSWWINHAAGGEPVVLCVYCGDEFVGGAAFERDRVGAGRFSVERLRSVGQDRLAPDHLDVIATDEHRGEVSAAVNRWLHRPGSRIVDLDGLASTGALAGMFAGHVIERQAAPYATLPESAADYLAARPGRVRSTVDRTARRLERAGVRHRRVEAVDAARGLADLARLHDGRWAERSEFLEAWDAFRAAATAGMTAGEVTIDELVTDEGQVIATELDLVVGARTHFYQAGRETLHEWRGAGSVLRAEVIRRSIDEGRYEYDLLRGDEAYKADWATELREVVRCRVGVGPLGRALLAASAVRRRAERARTAAGQRLSREPS